MKWISEKKLPQNEQAVQRKRTVKIIEKIYKPLDDGKYHTINGISRLEKSTWSTIKNQIDFIIKIQEMHKLKVIHA